MNAKPEKILIIGAAASTIGHNGELDGFTIQALDEFRKAGVKTVLLSPNSALASTDPGLADRTYIEPLLPATLASLAHHEKPSALFCSCGGRKALELAEELLEKRKNSGIGQIDLLGLDKEQITRLSDPLSFSQLASETNVPAPERIKITNEQELFETAKSLGFPFFIRFSHSEDGAGGRIIYNREELHSAAEQAFEKPPVQAIIAEKSLENRQESDLVVLRDASGNHCCLGLIEQLDPVGIHYLDSCWTWPAQTVRSQLQAEMEAAAVTICSRINLVGVAIAKFAHDKRTERLEMIGISPCLDCRSTFLERVLGIGLGQVTARLALGKSIEQALGRAPDAVPGRVSSAVRLPRWDLERFQPVQDCLTARCQSTGACLGLGDDFAEAFDHALSSLQAYCNSKDRIPESETRLMELLGSRTTSRYQLIREAIKRSVDPGKLSATTGISSRLIGQMRPGVKTAGRPIHFLPAAGLPGTSSGLGKGSRPPGVIFAGPGPFRIGYGPAGEANLNQALGAALELGFRPTVLNNNPDGLSTLGLESADVYWGPVNSKALLGVMENRDRDILIGQFGGRAAMKTIMEAATSGAIGKTAWHETVRLTTTKTDFRKTMRRLGIPQPETGIARSAPEIEALVAKIGFPLAITSAIPLDEPDTELILDAAMLEKRMANLAARAESSGIAVERFLEYAIEVYADAVSDGNRVLAPVIFEQVELAGVHGCDSALAAPPYSIAERHVETIEAYVRIAARELNLVGPFSIRLAIYRDTVYLLEVKPWASPTLPLTSKLCGLPLAGLAAKILLGKKPADLDTRPRRAALRAVRTAVFPFNVFTETDPLPGPLPRSTGEVLGLALDFGAAYFKSHLAGRMPLPTKGGVLITVTDEDKASVLEPARLLRSMGFAIKATRGTRRFLENHGIAAEEVRKIGFGRPNLVDEIKNRKVQIIINTPSGGQSQRDDAFIRKTAMAYSVVTITAPAAAIAAARGIATAVTSQGRPIALQDFLPGDKT